MMGDAPNVNLGPKASEADKDQAKAEDAAKMQRETARQTMKEQLAALKRQEAKEVPGAPTLELKGDLLDARALEKQNPDKYYRYLNTANKDRMPRRVHQEGFKPVDEKEASAAGVNSRVGNLVLSEQPREIHDRRVEAQNRENERRLRAHEKHMQQVAEQVSKTLRDKHGIDVPVDRLLVNE
jgi:hypothetical protein